MQAFPCHKVEAEEKKQYNWIYQKQEEPDMYQSDLLPLREDIVATAQRAYREGFMAADGVGLENSVSVVLIPIS